MRLRNLFLVLLVAAPAFLLQAQKSDWKSYLSQLKDSCKLSDADVKDAFVASHSRSPRSGMEVIWLRQTAQGLPIQGADMQLVLDKQHQLFKQQCHFVHLANYALNAQPNFDYQTGILKALNSKGFSSTLQLKDIYLVKTNKWKATQAGVKGNIYTEFSFWLSSKNEVKLAYTVRFTLTGSDALWQVRVDAHTGEIIDSHNLTLSCDFGTPNIPSGPLPKYSAEVESTEQLLNDGSRYRVFPYPLESPLNGPRVLLTNPADTQASPFGWHDLDGIEGADDTRSVGNNVNAYDDQNNDDAPDDYVYGGATLNFDFPFTPTPNNNPLASRDASITNLFYANNRMHDVLWHYGFDEEGGNFQYYNYTANGLGFDAVNAEGFDGSGTNNANFGTPPDGEAPRMQMYLWSNNIGGYLTVNTPLGIAGVYPSAVAAFGPQITPVPVTGQLVEMNDGSADPTFGCNFSIDDLTGKIVLIDRGSCIFTDKVLFAQQSGAIGVIVVNNQAGAAFSMGGADPSIIIPALMVSQNDGTIIRSALTGNVNVTINITTAGNYFDSSFDNGVIAHEYGHGISNRLTGGPLNTDCLYNEEQMGEGWSDFMALIMTSTIANSATEARAIGNYVEGLSLSGEGIRPFPYSRDMTINPVVYDDIQVLSIPHGLGTVWCSILWDMYWNLVDEYGYDTDLLNGNGGNNMAIQLVMDGMKLQTCSPGFIDGREAILQADELNYAGANRCLIWSTFARRGLGYSADQGSSESAFDGTSAFDIPPFCSTTEFANFTTSSISVCVGNSINYSDITEPASTTRTWTFEGGFPTVSSDSALLVTYSTPGTYTTTLTVTNSLGTDDMIQTITVVPSITVTANVGDASASADNGFIFITPSGGLAPYTTEWADMPGLNDLTRNLLASGIYPVTITDAAGCSIDTSFTVDRLQGIEEATAIVFRVQPNPFSGDLQVHISKGNQANALALYDISGRLLFEQRISGNNTELVQLPLSHISAGSYLLQVSFNNRAAQTRRVIKQ
jgi:PKD repeat protein